MKSMCDECRRSVQPLYTSGGRGASFRNLQFKKFCYSCFGRVFLRQPMPYEERPYPDPDDKESKVKTRCVECENQFEEDELIPTRKGPVCTACDEAPPEGVEAEDLFKQMLPVILSSIKDIEGKKMRTTIAALMMAARVSADIVSITIGNCRPDVDLDEYARMQPPKYIARQAVADADTLLAMLKETENADRKVS